MAPIHPPQWTRVATMLTETAGAVEHGTEIEGYHREARDDGTLDWV